MYSLVFAVAVLAVVMSGLALMLDFKEHAGWLFRFALVLVIGAAVARSGSGCLRGAARNTPLSGGDVGGLVAMAALALIGWWSRHSAASGRPPTPLSRRERALPAPPRFGEGEEQ
jgi:hypothetical protein